MRVQADLKNYLVRINFNKAWVLGQLLIGKLNTFNRHYDAAKSCFRNSASSRNRSDERARALQRAPVQVTFVAVSVSKVGKVKPNFSSFLVLPSFSGFSVAVDRHKDLIRRHPSFSEPPVLFCPCQTLFGCRKTISRRGCQRD